jgi:hypothetical protein
VVTFGAVAGSDEFAAASWLALAEVLGAGLAVSVAVLQPVNEISATDAPSARGVNFIIS